MNSKNFNYELLFPFVRRPSRYIGGEWNSIRKDEGHRQDSVGVCLVFPDLYEVGLANSGIEILYRVVNSRTDAYAERAYCVDLDFAALLRESQQPLFSLETRSPLASFDILGFSLPYELCYNNILEVLSLSGIPLRSKDRREEDPLVIGGGPCSVNPEPIADFFDAIVLGDGEDIIGEVIEIVKAHKKSKKSRAQLLESLLEVKGLYIPSFYEIFYNENGTIKKIQPLNEKVPSKIAYRQRDINKSIDGNFSFPTRPIVPYLQAVQDRVNVEIQRGCPWRCRFCQIGFTSHNYRERWQDDVVRIVGEGLKNTGYDAVTLSGLSAADHTEISSLLETLAAKFTPKKVSFGLPSTRADRFSVHLASKLQLVRRQTLTFAPEAGTERLRNVVRKELDESEILTTLKLSYEGGWKNVKLYFMYGLPTETKEDLDGIARLVRTSKKENPGLALTLTLSPFVPKPHTPFQWLPQDSLETLQNKLSYLRKNLSALVRAHGLEQIVLEGVLARGDRRCSHLLETVWGLGAKLDGWTEHFHWDLWQEAFKRTGIDANFYAHRLREESEIFPWDHLEGGPQKEALWKDLQSALNQVEGVPLTLAAGNRGQSLKGQSPISQQPPPTPIQSSRPPVTVIEKTVQKLRFKMSRLGSVRFVSHLEQIEMLRRALRRTELPVNYSHGFHPQIKCSFGPAISVGYESSCEYFDVELTKRMSVEDVRKSVSEQLPKGFSLVKVSSVPVFFPSLESLISRVDYEVSLPQTLWSQKDVKEWESILEESLKNPDLVIKESKRKGSGPVQERIIPLKGLLCSAKWDSSTLRLTLKFGPGKNVKPEKVASTLLGLETIDLRTLNVKKCRLYIENVDGSLVEP